LSAGAAQAQTASVVGPIFPGAGNFQNATGLSADGSVVVGNLFYPLFDDGTPQAAIWTANSGVTRLGNMGYTAARR